MSRPYSIAWAIVVALIFFAAMLSADTRHLTLFTDLGWLLVPAVLVGVPFSAWLPHARAGTMADHWRVPSQTLLMPRWLVCLIGTQMIGISLGLLALCLANDVRYGILCAVHSLGAIAFVISANRRFARPSGSEFVMPSPFPFPLRKRM